MKDSNIKHNMARNKEKQPIKQLNPMIEESCFSSMGESEAIVRDNFSNHDNSSFLKGSPKKVVEVAPRER